MRDKLKGTFGEVIDKKLPVLLVLSQGEHDNRFGVDQMMNRWQDNIHVVALLKEKNEELFKALKVNAYPTYMIYHNGEMKHRSSVTFSTANEFIERYMLEISNCKPGI